MESALRPRDIQARIRAGETPEDVAAAAQTTVEAIMVFAGPVLAERAHVASTAQRASVRRRNGASSSAGGTLGEAAEQFFQQHGLHEEDVEWDAWRRSDGRWVLVAAYDVGGSVRTAEFTHDLPGRYVVAENDEARVLIGELGESGSRSGSDPGTTAPTGPAPARRLGSVPFQDELPLGDDAIEMVRDRAAPDQPAPPDGWGAATAGATDADWIASDVATEAAEEPPEASPAETGADEISAGEPLDAQEPTPADELPAAKESAPPKRRSRSSVPSWDEIMFGGGNDD